MTGMSPSGLWLVVPLAPLLALLALLVWREKAISLWWLCTLPALFVSVFPAPALALFQLWPGKIWGGDDPLTRGLLGFTATLWLVAGMFAVTTLREDPRRLRFWLFWLTTFSGNLLLIIAQDALSFYVGFSVMSLSAYGLIVHYGGPGPRRAGRLYLQLAVCGELLLLTGAIMATYNAGGSTAFADWQNAHMTPLTVLTLLLGLGLKAGFWPLHVWLPQAHPAAPAPASAVLSGAMIKAGILGLWKFLPAADPGLQAWSQPLIIVGLFSAFYGVAAGLTRSQAKEVLAYSSVSQMGYLLIIVALAWHQSSQTDALATLLLLYAVHHGFCKGALFLAADLLKAGTPATRHLRRALQVLIAVPALALAGLPLSMGAGIKSSFEEQMYLAELDHLTIFLKFGAIASSLLLLRALYLLQKLSAHAPDTPIPARLLLYWSIPALATVALPWLWPTVRDGLMATLVLAKLFELAWPIALAATLAVLAWHRHWKLPDPLRRLPNPALLYSLRLKRVSQRPPVPQIDTEVREQVWRRRERRWNRFWQGNTMTRSTWLLFLFVIIAGLGIGFL